MICILKTLSKIATRTVVPERQMVLPNRAEYDRATLGACQPFASDGLPRGRAWTSPSLESG